MKIVEIFFQIVFFAQKLLSFFGIFPQRGIGREGIQFIETEERIVVVKETSSAIPTIA